MPDPVLGSTLGPCLRQSSLETLLRDTPFSFLFLELSAHPRLNDLEELGALDLKLKMRAYVKGSSSCRLSQTAGAEITLANSIRVDSIDSPSRFYPV
ncbi:hypothetical protein CI109_103879 [Kwoniella shandongensis]|uniref:Uncharacterized protein n=1 Tax=Kwoniella shandongensis TaxID=1734106 RepID=A0A5M6C877_9TREE|nr:uncharacterized protein CI109_000430 [Kwoniella shandongensis]KAA5530860.1 hypothetical protein CI109_000430 [Kwoniella shandongensis]